MISGLALVTFGLILRKTHNPPIDVLLGLAGLCPAASS